MANDAIGECTARGSIDIHGMRQIIGENFETKENGLYVKRVDDVLEAFAELCKGREQVICGVKTLKLDNDWLGDRGLLALAAILEAGHFCDVQELTVVCENSFSIDSRDAGQKFCNALQSGCLKNLRKLVLDGKGFGGGGIEAIAKSFQNNHPSKLEVFRLYYCLRHDEAGRKAVKTLANTIALGHLSNLRTLDLSGNEFAWDPLELSQNHRGVAEVESIGEALGSGHLPNLRKLNLSRTGLGNQGVDSLVKSFVSGHFTKLESLVLKRNKVGDAGAESLATAFASGRLGSLRKLDLYGNSIGGAGAKSLGESFGSGHLKTMETLDLGFNDLKDEGVESLVASTDSGNSNNLGTLGLVRCRVGDVGAKALARSFCAGNWGKLRGLNLKNNQIGGVGLAALVEALKSGHLTELKAVNLARDHGSYADSEVTEAARALGTGSLGSLESLHLFEYWGSVDRLSPEAKRALVNAYQKNPYLTVSICEGRGESRHDSEELNTLRERNEARVARLRKLQDEEEVSGEHGNVFLCGNPGVGKTMLRTTLTKGKSRFRTTVAKGICGLMCGSPNLKDREPTRGIEVSNLHSNGSTTGVQPVTLALWDMTEQYDYEVLQSAFLPDLNIAGGQATFFVIVCNANNGKNTPQTAREDLLYWLRFISSNSMEGIAVKHRRKVFVVFNCFARHTSGHEKKTWTSFLAGCKNMFGSLLNLHGEPIIMDFMNQKDVKPFGNFLLKEAREMLENRKMPKICRTVQEQCREWAKGNEKYPVLEWDQFSPIIGQCLWEEGKLRAAVEYLHEAGHLILFKRQAGSQASGSGVVMDPKSTGIQQTLVIMDPRWFCRNVVGNILLPNHKVNENEEALRELRRGESQKLPLSAFKKFIFNKSGVPQEKIDEVVVLLSGRGFCYQLPGRADDIFIPALIEGNDEPGWSTGSYNRNLDDRVMGFALLVQNLETALLPIAVLRRLQVDLALDDNFGQKPDSDYFAGRSCIKFKCEGMDVLVQYPMNPTTSESKQDRIVVVVKPFGETDGLTSERQTNLAQRIVNRILNITRDSCPGVKLDQRIITLERQ